jgi:hypothetical protein
MSEPRIFEVTVTVSLSDTYYVLADSLEAAQDDAKEITLDRSDLTVDDEDTHVREVEARQVFTGSWLWTGGPDGAYVADAAGYVRRMA